MHKEIEPERVMPFSDKKKRQFIVEMAASYSYDSYDYCCLNDYGDGLLYTIVILFGKELSGYLDEQAEVIALEYSNTYYTDVEIKGLNKIDALYVLYDKKIGGSRCL